MPRTRFARGFIPQRHGPEKLLIEPVKENVLYSYGEYILLPTIRNYPVSVTIYGPRWCIPISTHRGSREHVLRYILL